MIDPYWLRALGWVAFNAVVIALVWRAPKRKTGRLPKEATRR